MVWNKLLAFDVLNKPYIYENDLHKEDHDQDSLGVDVVLKLMIVLFDSSLSENACAHELYNLHVDSWLPVRREQLAQRILQLRRGEMDSIDEPLMDKLKKSCAPRTREELLDVPHLVDRSEIRKIVRTMRALYSDKFADKSNITKASQALRHVMPPREDPKTAQQRRLHEKNQAALLHRHE